MFCEYRSCKRVINLKISIGVWLNIIMSSIANNVMPYLHGYDISEVSKETKDECYKIQVLLTKRGLNKIKHVMDI